MELQLKEYILFSSKIYYGLTPKNIRELAYELALANQLKLPDYWIENKIASKEWFTSYMKRHPTLSIREPEGTSLSRATSFNRHNVGIFFNNLKCVLEKHKFENKDVWNADETGIQTVQRPGKIVTEKGSRQVAKATSAERGATLTVATAVNAIGNAIPPMFIFPRVHFKTHFIQNAPPGSIGSSHPSGWMTQISFLQFIKHFHNHVRSSKEHPCLLILDNHDSHLSIDVINFCKEKGIVMLSFPPHTSHRLQPLDKSVYGPFKKFYFAAVDNWMTNNPGKTLTIYDLPGIVKNSLPNALTPNNITAGFKATGIMPFNPDIFTDEDFLSCSVTDRPLKSIEEDVRECLTDVINTCIEGLSYSETSTSILRKSLSNNLGLPISAPTEGSVPGPSSSGVYQIQHRLVSPQDIRPYPKAGERKKNKKGKQSMKSQILTDTPVKNKLECETREREKKKLLKAERLKKRLFKSVRKEEITEENKKPSSKKNVTLHKKTMSKIKFNKKKLPKKIQIQKMKIAYVSFV